MWNKFITCLIDTQCVYFYQNCAIFALIIDVAVANLFVDLCSFCFLCKRRFFHIFVLTFRLLILYLLLYGTRITCVHLRDNLCLYRVEQQEQTNRLIEKIQTLQVILLQIIQFSSFLVWFPTFLLIINETKLFFSWSKHIKLRRYVLDNRV